MLRCSALTVLASVYRKRQLVPGSRSERTLVAVMQRKPESLLEGHKEEQKTQDLNWSAMRASQDLEGTSTCKLP